MTNQAKNLAFLKKKQQKIESGKISDRFPEVSKIIIQVTNLYGKKFPITIKRTLNFVPDSYAYFHIECLRKRCIDGGFNLDSIITKLISSHKYSKNGELVCTGSNLSKDHSYIQYEVAIKYKRK